MKIINTENMPKSNGHYSHCVEHNGVLYISGQLPFDPKTREMPEGIVAQAHQVLSNLKLILTEAGSSVNQVMQVRIYIPDVELWGAVNEVYAEYFVEHKPARCVVPSRELHFGALIELEATAYV